MPLLQLEGNFELENGKQLVRPQIQYHTYGRMNQDASNVIWVCHALTASSDVFDWWAGLFGSDAFFNPQEHFIVCANFLGSHYGTTGPLSINPETEFPYFHDFPAFTIRDMVKLHIRLADYLGVDNIHLLIGGSMGGHQALEWSIMQPSRIDHLCLLATSAVISPWAAALNHTQRAAIESDASWKESNPKAGEQGMSVARAIALLSYRNQTAYNSTQQENLTEETYPQRAASYQQYQGKKLTRRFNAFSYWHIAKAMDSHNVGRNRGSVTKVLGSVQAKTLVLTIEHDLLFPEEEQIILKEGIPKATHKYIKSGFGHDGFLIEMKQIEKHLTCFLKPCVPA